MDEDEIPIGNPLPDDPLIDEASEEQVTGELSGELSEELSEDIGGYNELPNLDDLVTVSYDMGDIFIMILEKRDVPFMCKIVEILPKDGLLKMEDDSNKIITFLFESGDIILKTDDYEIVDMIRVIPYEPDSEDDKDDSKEYMFDVDELVKKKYSEYAKKDDLLSSLIRSMDIYDNQLLIEKVEIMIHNFTKLLFDVENPKVITQLPYWLIPIIEDNLKLYDEENELLSQELNEQFLAENDKINNYREFLNNSFKYSKPIHTTTGHGCETDEYSGIYLRNCLQENNCSGILGSYMYDERINSKPILLNDSTILPSNNLRLIGLLEEPINKLMYSVNLDSLSVFTVFEKYIYNFYNKDLQFRKKDKMKEAYLVSSTEDDLPERDVNKYIIHNLPEYTSLSDCYNYREGGIIEIMNVLVKNEISNYIYNLTDIEKLLFKYKINYSDLKISDRNKITELLKNNIRRYHDEYVKSVKSLPKETFKIRKIPLTDENRLVLSYDYIFSLTKREKKNHYLRKFIDIFTRESDKVTESPNYLYNKYTGEKILCKHYLYDVNITNQNDVFDKMKSKFGLPPQDGYISCKICGGYLCDEEASLFDGYQDDKPMVTREVIREDKNLEIDDYLSEKEEISTIIKLIGGSLGVPLEKDDIYEILLSYELIDHDELSDIRYGMQKVSETEIHPRVSKEIERLKKLEKKEKDKLKKKEYKEKRFNVMKSFQKWLKNTNKVLMITSLTALYIQTAIPSFFTGLKKNKSFELINIIDHDIDRNVLKYLSAKIRRLSEKYNSEQIWENCLGLMNEKEFGTNEIDIQLGLVTKYCLEPNFPKIIKRITQYEDFIESEKHKYLKEEWVTFKPLQKNVLVKGVKDFLESISEQNHNYLRKIYGGNTIENSSIVRPLTESLNIPLSDVLGIPEVSILKNNSFKKLFRYAVSLYGIHPSNLFITLTFQRLLETCDKRDEILRIMKKSGYNEESNGFTKLDFSKLRQNVIPEILALYGDKNTNIQSCYTNEKTCNAYIHNMINTYDLSLLNTYPKRIYNYITPIVYPELPFGRLVEERKDFINKLFSLYAYDELGDIVRKTEDKYHYEFLSNTIQVDENIPEINKYKTIDLSPDNFNTILNTLGRNNSLSYRGITKKKYRYTVEDYLSITNYASLEDRFTNYLVELNTDNLTEEHKIINEKLVEVFSEIMESDKSSALEEKHNRLLRDIFSQLIIERNESVNQISIFLSRSDEIEPHQKSRFVNIYKNYNPGERIVFQSQQLSTILKLFIDDVNVNYSHLVKYLTDIRNIFAHLMNKEIQINKLPKEWKTTDQISLDFQDFIDREGNSVYLTLHNNVFMKTKDLYTGFNRYLNDETNNRHYFRLLFNYLDGLFVDLDKMKGSINSKYNEKYADIYMKYHFMNLFSQCIRFINELRDSRSDVTSDANDLFQSLEQRDEDLIEDMIEILSQFVMDLITHVLYQHYDPSWLFLNEQKLDLANRLSKQKEKEKQILIDKFDTADKEKRFSMIQQQKMGISSWHHEGAAQGAEYVKSEEYLHHTEDERRERFNEIKSLSNVENDVLSSQNGGDEVIEISESVIDPMAEEEGYVIHEEYDPEDEDYEDELLDDELQQEYNE